MAGSGNDIWGTTDELHYAHQPLPEHGQVTARILGQGNSDPWAKAGVMIKQSTDPLSPYAFLAATPGHGVHFQYNFNGDQGGPAVSTFPLWLRLARADTTVVASTSTDGVTFTPVGTATVPLAGTVTAGLAVTAHAQAVRSVATFDGVAVEASPAPSPPPGPVPSPWVAGDTGGPALAGSAGYEYGVFTVRGAGSDVWGDADQFSSCIRRWRATALSRPACCRSRRPTSGPSPA